MLKKHIAQRANYHGGGFAKKTLSRSDRLACSFFLASVEQGQMLTSGITNTDLTNKVNLNSNFIGCFVLCCVLVLFCVCGMLCFVLCCVCAMLCLWWDT